MRFRLGSIVFGALVPLVLAPSTRVQLAVGIDAEVRVVDLQDRPLPPGLLQVRSEAGELVPGEFLGNGAVLFRAVGRRVTFELVVRGRERSRYDVVLLDHPLVEVSFTVDTATGSVQAIAQKPARKTGAMRPRVNVPDGSAPEGGAPVNDDCANALPIPCNSTIAVTNAGATTDPSDPFFGCSNVPFQGFGTLWFSFVASGPSATIDTDLNFRDTWLAVYSGSCGSLVEIGCNDDISVFNWSSLVSLTGLSPGATYLIEVATQSAFNQGPFPLSVDCTTALDGNLCVDPIELSCDDSVTFDNTLFTTDGTDPDLSCLGYQGSGTGWFTFVATDTSAKVEAFGNLPVGMDFNVSETVVALYDGTCGSLVELCCNTDTSLATLCCDGLTVGNTYYVQAASVESFFVNRGNINVTVECPCPAPPANDDCADAIALGALPVSVAFDSFSAQGDVPAACGPSGGHNAWYSVVGTGNTLRASTCNSGTHPQVFVDIRVFCGDCLAPICVTDDNDGCPSPPSTRSTKVEWCSQAGATYLLSVGTRSQFSQGGDIQLDVSDTGLACAPTVQCPPTGACCLTDGSCAILTLDACVASGGTYLGDGSVCATNAIADGGFQDGAFAGFWTEFSSSFATPLREAGGPSSDRRAWFGGTPSLEEGYLEQSAVIPAGASTLDYRLEIPAVSGNGDDFLEVLIDGFQVGRVPESGGPFAGDIQVSIPLGDFADGEVHTVTFHSIVTGAGGPTSFFVDDVTIEGPVASCIECTSLDFSASNEGPLGHGQDLETAGETFGCVTISGGPIGGGPLGNAGAAIFDSTNGPAGQDPDLMVGRGNVLILQNNQNAQVLSKSGDSYLHPNDDHDGGTLTFTFCEPVDATTVDLIDIDDANGPGLPDGATVVLTDVDGFTHTITVPDGWTANGGVGVLDLKSLVAQPGVSGAATASEQVGYDASAVVSIAVTLQASGAVDNLEFCH